MTDCLGVPLTACAEEEISAMGAAVMAMASTGVGDIRSCAKAMARFDDVSEPNPEMTARYREIGAVQGELYDALKGIFPKLEALG